MARELAAHTLHDPYGLNERMDDNDGVPYQSWETHHSESTNALGMTTLHQPELDCIDQDCTAPHQVSSRDHPFHPPEAVTSASTLAYAASCEPNTSAPQEFYGPVDLGACHLGNQDYTEPTSKALWTTVRSSLPGSYCEHPGPMIPWPADNAYHPYDFLRTSQLHAIPQTLGSTHDFTDPGAGNPSDPWSSVAQAQDTPRIAAPVPRRAEGHFVEHLQEAGQSGVFPPFQILSSRTMQPPSPTVSPPIVQYGLDDVARIHKHMRRSVGGGATCTWVHEGDECGYSSHVDLVKRHIKRVHYRLKPCACKYCGRRFFNNYALSLHYNAHTGKRPFLCEICGKGFASPSGKSHHRITKHKHRIQMFSVDQHVRWVNVPFGRRDDAIVERAEPA